MRIAININGTSAAADAAAAPSRAPHCTDTCASQAGGASVELGGLGASLIFAAPKVPWVVAAELSPLVPRFSISTKSASVTDPCEFEVGQGAAPSGTDISGFSPTAASVTPDTSCMNAAIAIVTSTMVRDMPPALLALLVPLLLVLLMFAKVWRKVEWLK